MSRVLAAVILSLAVGSAVAGEKLLVFSAKWCGACQHFKRDYERDRDMVGSMPVSVVDVDECRNLARQFRVKSIPVFVIVDGDSVPANEKRRTVGYDGPQALRRWLGK